MKSHLLLSFLLLIFVFCSCNFKERKEELQQKTEQLAEKEKQLLLWEKKLKLKEDSINLLLAKRDSSLMITGIAILPLSLEGEWTVKMVCTQTSCPSSAIGDVQTDVWHISNQDSSLVIKTAASRVHAARIYTGNYYQNNTIRVSDKPNNAAATNATIRMIEITEISSSKMKGNRTVIQPDGCRVVYSLELEPKQ
jgi:hypothetical protein